jgi:hypothetical protein
VNISFEDGCVEGGEAERRVERVMTEARNVIVHGIQGMSRVSVDAVE